MIVARIAAALAGLILVAAAAYGNVVYSGGFGTPASYATCAMAFGVVVGSAIVGYVRTMTLVAVLLFSLVAGEAYALLMTANRVVVASDALQAPLIDAKQRHDDALKALAKARNEKPVPVSRDRLEAAERAKTEADKAAREQASLRTCLKNCAALLRAAADDAAREVEAARAEIANHDKLEADRIAALVTKAEAMLKAAPMPASATPFADRIGMAPWALDLLIAFLLSIGLNVLAAAFFAFATHSERKAKTIAVAATSEPVVVEPMPAKKAAPDVVKKLPSPIKLPLLSIVDFGADNLAPAPGDTLDFDEFFNAYAAAARESNLSAYGPMEFVEPFKRLCDEAGIRIRKRGTKVFLCDVKLAA